MTLSCVERADRTTVRRGTGRGMFASRKSLVSSVFNRLNPSWMNVVGIVDEQTIVAISLQYLHLPSVN